MLVNFEGGVKTRFCPSPTGLMHLGNLRTALFNALFAINKKGCFLLRIEDTDQERSDSRYAVALMEDLLWLGLRWQEGPEQEKGNEPYYQSQRQFIYDDYYQRLETVGIVYPCFCSESELAFQRKSYRVLGKPPRYPGTCRSLSQEQREELYSKGLKPTLRFAVPQNQTIEFTDLVRGHQQFNTNDIGDFIIRRADGSPPFLFCNAIDDALMGVTHAIRGEDHLANTPRQLMILDALGLEGPDYGHVALIVGADGGPLSKRHGSRSIKELRSEGYLATALLNYIARQGHYYGHDDLLSLEQLAEQFRIKSLSKSPAKFNLEQLQHWQKRSVGLLDIRGFWLWVGEGVEERVPEESHALFVETLKHNVTFPQEVIQWIDIFFSDHFVLNEEQQRTLLELTVPNYFKEAIAYLELHGFAYEPLIKHLSRFFHIKGKKLYTPLRLALTGLLEGPELNKMFLLLGENEIKRRLGFNHENL